MLPSHPLRTLSLFPRLGGLLKGDPKDAGQDLTPRSELPRAGPLEPSAARAWRVYTAPLGQLERISLRQMQAPGAWLSRKCLCQEEKGCLSLERCIPAITLSWVPGGLLNWAPLCIKNSSAQQGSPATPPPLWLQSAPLCRARLGGCSLGECSGERTGCLGVKTSDPPGRTGLPPAGSRGRQWLPQHVP